MALQIRRGLDSDRGTVTPLVGEPVWTTDTKKLYVGDGSTAGGHDIVAAGLANVSGHIVPQTDSTYDLGDSSRKFRDLYLSGNSIYLGDNLVLRNDGGTFQATDSSNTPITISLNANTTSDLAEGNNLYYTTARSDSDFDVKFATKDADALTEGSVNLYFTNVRADERADVRIAATVDSAYVQARQTSGSGFDSAAAIELIDSAYVQERQTSGGGGGIDSATTIALIDSDYVQARQLNPVSAFTTIAVSGQTDIVADNSEAGLASPYTPTQQAKLEADTPANLDLLGHTAAISNDGNVAVVGAIRDDTTTTDAGAAFVYTRSGSTWTRAAKLLDSTGSATDYFGYPDVDISGDGGTIAILNSAGEAFIFTGSGSSWSQQTKITTGNSGLFSCSLSVDGNIFIVGNGPGQGGNSKLYTRSGSTWSSATTLQRGDAVEFSNDGSYLIIGDQGTGNDTGTAYILTGSGSSWTSQATLNASDAAASDKFGEAVAIDNDGNTVIIGASNDGGNTTGAAYVFTRSGTTWTQEQKLTASDAASTYDFGFDVDITADGNTVIIGSPGRNSEAGAYYVFERSGSTWSETNIFVSSDLQAGDQFGYEVTFSSDGTTALVGAVTEDGSGGSARGAAYIFTAPTGTSLQDKLTLAAGSNITITTDASTDTVTIAASSSIDSAGTIALVDSAYVQARQTSAGGGNDSATTIALIDSAYVQARQTTADLTNYRTVTQIESMIDSNVNAVIDAAPGALDTLNELAAALGDDANFSTTITNQIAGKLDSAQTIAIIDSAYVQARQSAGTDSAAVIALIDSSYVQARQVNPVSAFTTVAVSGQSDIVADNSEGGASWVTSTETGDLEPNDSVASQHLGWSTDISDDGLYVVAGSPYNTGPGATQAGRAFIHYYNGSSWSVQQRLDPPGSDVVAYLNFGWAVAIDADGNTVAVTARNSNTNGRVYVYTRSGSTWALQQTLAPTKSNGYFGISVDISEDGDMITVGHQDAVVGSGPKRTGAVEIFTRSGSTWSSAQLIEENNNDFPTDAKIGWSNELASEAKDRLIFGAYSDKSAWVWVNSGGWARESELTPSNTPSTQNDSYGYAVSINADGTVAAVSDPGADGESSETKAGNVYIFTRSGSTWTQQQRLYSATQAAGDFFGHALNLSGDGTRVYIGVSRQDASSTTEGEVQIWKNTGGTWAIESTVNSSDTTSSENNRFASKNQSVAVTKDAAYLAVGAHEQSSGAVYVYTAATGTSLQDKLTLAAGSNITITTDASTDTVTIAASTDSTTTQAMIDSSIGFQVDSAYVQARQTSGGGGGIDSATTIALIDSDYIRARQTTPIPAFTKISISGQGDIIADSDEGIANWASGSQQQKLTASDAASNDRFGYDLDISGNGNYALIGAPWESTQRGKAYVYVKSGTSWSEQATLTASDGGSNDYFGIGIKISEDGSTAVVGAKGAGAGTNGTGKAYVFTRSGSTWSQDSALTASDAADGDLFGAAVDISDDGNTIVVGAYGEDTGSNARGQGYVYVNGKTTTLTGSSYDNVYRDFKGSSYTNGITGSFLNNPKAILFNNDGTKLFISNGDNYIYQFNVQTPYDISTMTYSVPATTFYVGAQSSNNDSMHYNRDGTKFYISDTFYSRITEYDLSTPYDIMTASYNGVQSDFSANVGAEKGRGFGLASDGSAYFIGNVDNSRMFKYGMSTAWDLSTASYSNSYYTLSGSRTSSSVIFNDAGTKMFILNYAHSIKEYTLTVPNDPTTGTVTEVASLSITSQNYQGTDFTFNDDMSKIYYVARGSSDQIYQYSTGGADTEWFEQQKFQGSDTETADNFGFAVAISGNGNNLVFGTPFEDTGASSTGKAYIFTKSSTGNPWQEQAKIQGSGALSTGNQEFGYSVDMSTDGNTIALGSRDDTGGGNRGAAFIFTRTGSTWIEQAKIENANEADYDLFAGGGRGVSLSGTGNTLVVGAYGDDDNGSQSGSTFVFTRTGTTWSQAKQIATSDAAANDENGFAVAIDKNGDTLLTGSYAKNSSTGATYVWTAPLAVQLQDTLTLEAGSGITLTNTSGTDTITITSSGNDSATTIALIDSAYIQARSSGGNDSATTIALIDSAYIQARSSGGNDSATTIALIDSSYVQDRQIKYTNADFADSSFVTTQINNLIDGAPGTLNTLNEIAAALNDDDSAYSTLIGLINAKSDLDSSAAITLIDSSYIQARSSGGNDSATTIALIDSAYVQARQTSDITSIDSSLSTTDSAQIIDSFAAATFRTTKYIAQLSTPVSLGYTNWPIATQQQIIYGNETGMPDTIGNNDEFGRGVAIGSNKILIGATRNDYGTTNAGVAVYYTRDSANGTWSYSQFVQPSASGGNDYFGQAISADSDFNTIAVTGHTEGLYIFDRSSDSDNTTWSQTFKVIPSTTGYSNAFQHVAISKDGATAITGSHYDNTERGKAYIYAKDSAGTSGSWALESTLTASNAGNYDFFGKSVALGGTNGNIAAVAATQEDTAGSNAGAVYIYRRTSPNFLLDFADIGKNSGQYNAYTGPGANGRDQGFKDFLLGSPALSEPHGIDLHPDGTKVFITSNANQSRIAMFTMSTAYDMQTATYTNSFSNVEDEASAIKGIKFNPDGTKLFVANSTAEADSSGEHAIFQYSLSTAYDLTTASYANKSINIGTTSRAQDIQFNLDGTKMFVLDDDNAAPNGVREYTLSTAYDISTASYVDIFSVSSQEGSPRGLTFNLDGTKMYISGDNSDKVFQYGLSTAFDVSTASYDNTFLDAQYETNQVACHRWRADGSQIFISNTNQEGISTFYTKNATWAQDTAFLTVSGSTKLGDAGALAISPDGSYIYAGSTGEAVNSVNNVGAVHVWRDSSGSGTYTYDQKLVASDGVSGTKFGSSLALDGKNLLVGAVTEGGSGAAYVFTQGTDGSWTQRKKVGPSDANGNQRFGGENGVSISGKDFVVGSWNYPSAKGRAYVFNTTGPNADARDEGYHSEEILLMHNGTNVAMTSYGKLLIDSDLGTFDAVIADSGSNVNLTLSPTYANTTVKLKAIRTQV